MNVQTSSTKSLRQSGPSIRASNIGRTATKFVEKEIDLNSFHNPILEGEDVSATEAHAAPDNEETKQIRATDNTGDIFADENDLIKQIAQLRAALAAAKDANTDLANENLNLKTKKIAGPKKPSGNHAAALKRRKGDIPNGLKLSSAQFSQLSKVNFAYAPHDFEYISGQKAIMGDTYSLNHYIGSEKAISVLGLWSAARSVGRGKKDSQIGRKQYFHFQNEYTVQSQLSEMILKLGTQQEVKKTLKVDEQFITGNGAYTKEQKKVVDRCAKRTDGGKVVTGQVLTVKGREKHMILREMKINLSYCRLGIVFGGHCYIELRKRDDSWFRVDLADETKNDMFFQEYLLWSRIDYSSLLDLTHHYPGYLDRYLTPELMVETAAYAGQAGSGQFLKSEAPAMIAAQEKAWREQRAKYIVTALDVCDKLALTEEEKVLKSLKAACSGQFNAMKQQKDAGAKNAFAVEAAGLSRDAAKIESKLFLKRTLTQAYLDCAGMEKKDKIAAVSRRVKEAIQKKWGGFKTHMQVDVYNACVARLTSKDYFGDIPELTPSLIHSGCLIEQNGELVIPPVIAPEHQFIGAPKKRDIKAAAKEEKKDKKNVQFLDSDQPHIIDLLNEQEKFQAEKTPITIIDEKEEGELNPEDTQMKSGDQQQPSEI